MFQLKLNDIEPVSKPEYYRKNIIAIIGDPRMLKTEGCAPSVAQRENKQPQPHRPRADDPDRFRPDHRIKFGGSFSYLLHGGRLPRLPSFVERVRFRRSPCEENEPPFHTGPYFRDNGQLISKILGLKLPPLPG